MRVPSLDTHRNGPDSDPAFVYKRKSPRYVGAMSAIGITPQTNEIEQLRKAYRSINDLLKNLGYAEACLKNLDLKMTGDHLKVLRWNAEQAQKAIAAVGQKKTIKGVNRDT